VTGTWQRYYAAAGDEPRPTLVDALARHEAEGRAPGLAVDLGCGSGRDTVELLRRGWRVVAVDAERAGIEALEARPEAVEADGRLETVVATFAEARWPDADLVNASFSLPFMPPPEFTAVWARLVASLRPGGRFAGHLFGVRDEWAPAPDMTFLTRAEAEALFDGFEVESFEEIERDGPGALVASKRWHGFFVVARRP
jgi:tellurite methyltransferase